MLKLKQCKWLLLVFGILVGALCFRGYVAGAKSYSTKGAVQKEIKTLQEKRKKLKKLYNAEKKKENNQRKGNVTSIFAAKIISNNPLILEQAGLFGGKQYYWVTGGSQYLSSLLTVCSGYVKTSGKTRVYRNGQESYTCNLCTGVKVSYNSQKYQKQIENVDKKMKKLRNSLKNKVILKEAETVIIGTPQKLNYYLKYSDSYNKVTFQSSNKKIATVTNSGLVKGKKPGAVKITAICSITKKKATKKIYIASDFHVSYSVNNGEWKQLSDDEDESCMEAQTGDTITLRVDIEYKNNQKITYKLTKGTNITVDKKGIIKCQSAGSAIIKVDTEDLFWDIRIEVRDPSDAGPQNTESEDSADDESQDTESEDTGAEDSADESDDNTDDGENDDENDDDWY